MYSSMARLRHPWSRPRSRSRSIYIVSTCEESPYSVAIYEIMIDNTHTVLSSSNIKPLTLALPTPKSVSSPSVGCALVGSDLFFLASYESTTEKHSKFIHQTPLLCRTNTRQLLELPKPKVCKPFPTVIGVAGRVFALADSRDTDVDINGMECPCPSFECFDPRSRAWNSSPLPDLPFPGKSTLHVGGYAVVLDTILISAVAAYCTATTEFFRYEVESDSKEWQVVSREDEAAEYPSFEGKAEYIDGSVYAFIHDYELIAYSVKFTRDGVIQSLGRPLRFGKLDFADPPSPCHSYPLMVSSCFAHVGRKVFCFVRTRVSGDRSLQYASVLTAEVSEDMELITISSVVCSMNVSNLGEACYFSDCFCPKISEDHGSRARSLSKRRILRKDLLLDNFLHYLGLEKYLNIFEDEEIDLDSLEYITDDDLKALGLPMGPRKKILLALKSVF